MALPIWLAENRRFNDQAHRTQTSLNAQKTSLRCFGAATGLLAARDTKPFANPHLPPPANSLVTS